MTWRVTRAGDVCGLELLARAHVEEVGGAFLVLEPHLDTAGVRCPDCSTQYGHSEALRLPLAERRAA